MNNSPETTGSTTDPEQRCRALFDLVVDRDPAERQKILAQARADDPELCRKVEVRLAHCEQARQEKFLEEPLFFPVADLSAVEGATVLPKQIGRFRIESELGRGGMGVVYKARQLDLPRDAAVKMIVTGEYAGTDAMLRFRSEAEALASLQHPNVVQIYEFGEHDGRPFFAMEFVDGGGLDEKLNGTPLPARQAAEFLEVLARAIHVAHQRGIIHRDLKPANVLLQRLATENTESTEGGPKPPSAPLSVPSVTHYLPKISDFGLAKRLNADQGQTPSEAILGTPSYMSPEQAGDHAKKIGPPTDVYALGTILYEMLTGRPPFRGETDLDTLLQVRMDEPVPPSRLRLKLPRDLETICLTCLQKEPHKRYATAQALAEDLDRFLAGKPILARPVGHSERFWRWCRRNPMVAGLSAAAIFFLLTGTIVASFFAYYANLNAIAAEGNATQLRAEKRLSDSRLYAAHMNLTQRLFERGQVAAALELLDGQRPERTNGIDLRGWEWYYLKRLCHSELLTLRGHTGEVRSVALSPDGLLVASGGADRTVRLWAANTGKLLHTLRGHIDAVNTVAFDPNGQQLASASDDTTVKIWDATTGKQVFTYQGHILAVKSLAFRPDGKQLATASEDGTVRLWDTEGTDQLILQMHLEDLGINTVAFSPDGNRLATTSWTGNVRLWDARTGKEELTKKDPTYSFTGISFSPDGRRLALIGSDPHIYIWDSTTGKEGLTLQGHTFYVASAVFSPDGRWLASGGQRDNLIKLWDSITGKEIRTFGGHLDGIHSVTFSRDGKRLASASLDGTVKVWNPSADQEALTLLGHVAHVNGLAFSPNGQRLVSGGTDHSVRIWDAATGKALLTLGRHRIQLAPRRGQVHGLLSSVTTYEGHTGFVTGAAFSPDGKLVASCSGYDGTVRVWDATDGKELAVIKHGWLQILDVAFTPDCRHVAAFSPRDGIKIWNFSNEVVLRITDGGHRINQIAFSPDGTRLASACDDRAIHIWDVATGQELFTLHGHSSGVSCVAFNRDGGLLASGSEDRTLRVWDLATGKDLLTCRGHSGRVSSVVFSPDGRRLFSTGGGLTDRTVKVWDRATGQELLTLPGEDSTVAFSPVGNRLAYSVGNSHTIKILNADPVDDQSYRLASAKPSAGSEEPPADLDQADVSAVGTTKLKVLGFFTAKKLPAKRSKDQLPVVKPRGEDKQFVVVVVSVPHHYLTPSEKEYEDLQKKSNTDPTKPPLRPRNSITIENARRFNLLLGDGRSVTGVLYGPWPMRPQAGEGFSPASSPISHYVPISPSRRWCFAVAWQLDLADCKGPFSVKIGDSEPVAVPNLQLQPPPFDWSAVVVHAIEEAKRGEHAEAVADAHLAVQNQAGNSDTIYDAACVYSRASAAVRRDAKLTGAEQNQLAERYAAHALALLRQAVQKGFTDAAHMRKDPDLDSLRAREDFQELLAELEKTPKPRAK